MPELALDDEQRHALARHFDGVSVAELMGRKSTSHPAPSGRVMQLGADAGGRPLATGGRASKDAEQRPDRELRA